MSYNTPVQILQGGSVLNIGAGGSLVTTSAAQVALGNITLGGTVGKWSFGTATLTSGVGTLGFAGFTRVLGATANIILGEASGNGSATGVHVDLTLSGAGSVIFRALAGTLGYAANQVISYHAFGT